MSRNDHIRLVSNQSSTERGRRGARDDLELQLRKLTTNLLRATNGAGKCADLPNLLASTLEAYASYAEAYGSLPSQNTICRMLDPNHAFLTARPWVDPSSYSPEHQAQLEALDKIRRGAVQTTASMLLDQITQMQQGQSKVHEGVRELNAAIDRRKRH